MIGEPPVLVLGSALWGWSVGKLEAFRLLDLFAASGGLLVDTASNYPIDQNPAHYGLAAAWLSEWMAANPHTTLKVWLKVGGADNVGGREAELSPSYLRIARDLASAAFGDRIACIGVHWDNRTSPEAIGETVAVFENFADEGLAVGLSGIAVPSLYAEASPRLRSRWWIQVKEHLLDRNARKTYAPYLDGCPYFAYGINMGGMNLGPRERGGLSSATLRKLVEPSGLETLRAFLQADNELVPRPRNLNQLALLAASVSGLQGVVIGPSSIEQLQETLDFWSLVGQPSETTRAVLSALTARVQP